MLKEVKDKFSNEIAKAAELEINLFRIRRIKRIGFRIYSDKKRVNV